ncbi:odorant receptor 10-like [Rhynchophorus ferrugineus]|uniref:odorant receptor 10-like n=1 Tax=Rhynchophorus ferrugineus TaxID=354439 RepID=UPI003FCD6FD4
MKHNLSLEAPTLYPIFFPNKNDHKVIIYILNFIFGYECLLAPIVYILPTTCLVFCACQLSILQIKLEKLRDLAKTNYEGDIIKALKDLIKHHQFLIRFTMNLNDSIKYLILVDFILSSIIDASIMTQITKFETMSQILSSTFYLLSLVILIFSVGWTCNEISVQSIALADAVYQSHWYEFDGATTKLIHILMMRSQRPLTIGIGPFGAMGNEAVILIMKATYSYITLMQQ